MEQENVVADNSNTAEEVVLETTEGTATESQNAESVEEVKSRLAKAEELANNYKIRAEKAEKANKLPKETTEVKPKSDISTLEAMAIIKANVHEDDMEKVQKFAQMEGLSIRDALKSVELQAILNVRAENRKTAEATNTSSVKRGVAKVSGETLLKQAQEGKMPESEADIAALIVARRSVKK